MAGKNGIAAMSSEGRQIIKAQEVLRRYAAGERNFCNANLRGANFKGQDLSGADFSGADICSANFTNANLRGVNFSRIQSGLQRRWMILQLLLVIVIAFIAGVLQGFAGALTTYFLDNSNYGSSTKSIVAGSIVAGVVCLLPAVVTYGAIALQGFTIRALGSILSAFAVAFAVAVAFADVFVGAFAGAVSFTVAVAGTVSFA